MKELMFQKELTLIKQRSQKNLCFVIFGIFKDIGFKIQPYACNGCYNLSMVYDLDDLMILNIKGVDYGCFVCNMSKNTAIKLLNNSYLDDKGAL